MIDLTRIKKNYQKEFSKIKDEIGKVVIGYEDTVDDFLICLMTGGHLLIEGVPGVAKTTLIKVFAQVTSLSYERVQFTQDTLPADVLGHYYYDMKEGTFELRKGPVFAQVLMADEINRAPPKTQSALIEAMQEKQATIEGTTHPLPKPFFVIATKNPIETEGVYPLPEAQLDRFMIKSDMGYLDPEKELNMLRYKSRVEDLDSDLVSQGTGLKYSGIHRNVHISENVLEYIHDIIIETRNEEHLALGASPRAGEHLLYASKATALINGRDYVIPDDVKSATKKVIPHRLILTVDAELEGINSHTIVNEILENGVEAPKGRFKNA